MHNYHRPKKNPGKDTYFKWAHAVLSANRLSLSTPEGQKYILYFRDISPWILLNALYTGLSQQIYVMSQLTWYKLKPNLYEPYVLRVRVSLYNGFETTRKPHSFKMSGKKTPERRTTKIDQNKYTDVRNFRTRSELSQKTGPRRSVDSK